MSGVLRAAPHVVLSQPSAYAVLTGGTGRDGFARSGKRTMKHHRQLRLLAAIALAAVIGSSSTAWAGSKSLGFTGHPFGGSTLGTGHGGTCCGLHDGLHGKRLFPHLGFVHRKSLFHGKRFFHGGPLFLGDEAFPRKRLFRYKSLFHNKRLVRSKKPHGGKRLLLGHDRGIAIFAGKHLSAEPARPSCSRPVRHCSSRSRRATAVAASRS